MSAQRLKFHSNDVVKKIILLCLAYSICLATLTGCGSERVSRLEFELYRVTSKIEQLESKIDMLRGSASPMADVTEVQVKLSREQLEKLIADLKAQVSLKPQANESSAKDPARADE